jgi:putative N-acetylmannosamine-6-phosphate epimerase
MPVRLPRRELPWWRIDATDRPRPQFDRLGDFIAAIQPTGLPVLADVSTCAEGIAAEQAGADLVSTTLSGYTDYSPLLAGPDLALVAALSQVLSVPLLAEGRYHTRKRWWPHCRWGPPAWWSAAQSPDRRDHRPFLCGPCAASRGQEEAG